MPNSYWEYQGKLFEIDDVATVPRRIKKNRDRNRLEGNMNMTVRKGYLF